MNNYNTSSGYFPNSLQELPSFSLTGRHPSLWRDLSVEWEAAFEISPGTDFGSLTSGTLEIADEAPAEHVTAPQGDMDGDSPVAIFVLSAQIYDFMPDDEMYHTGAELESQIKRTDAPASTDSSCVICMGEREITVQFGECSHAACGPCLEGLWHGRKQHNKHLPEWISCHMCRAEVSRVGALSRAPPTAYGEEVVHGDEVFTVWGWQGVRRWMASRRESVSFELSCLKEAKQ